MSGLDVQRCQRNLTDALVQVSRGWPGRTLVAGVRRSSERLYLGSHDRVARVRVAAIDVHRPEENALFLRPSRYPLECAVVLDNDDHEVVEVLRLLLIPAGRSLTTGVLAIECSHGRDEVRFNVYPPRASFRPNSTDQVIELLESVRIHLASAVRSMCASRAARNSLGARKVLDENRRSKPVVALCDRSFSS